LAGVSRSALRLAPIGVLLAVTPARAMGADAGADPVVPTPKTNQARDQLGELYLGPFLLPDDNFGFDGPFLTCSNVASGVMLMESDGCDRP
jgi:hypothetical protein